MVTFCGWGWREKQKDILQMESLGGVLQERRSNIFGKTYWKTSAQRPFSKEVSGCRPDLYLKRGSCKGFFSVKFSEHLFCSIVQTWIAASDLMENLETLTISEDLRKSLHILTIIVDFTENIWDFSVTMKRSENRI